MGEFVALERKRQAGRASLLSEIETLDRQIDETA